MKKDNHCDDLNRCFLALTLALIFLFLPSAYGQGMPGAQIETEQQGNQGEHLKMQQLRTLPDKAADSDSDKVLPPTPMDEALGQQRILKRKPVYKPFSVFAESSFNATNNVALTRYNKVEDQYLLLTTGASYQPLLTSNLIGEVTVMEQWYRYKTYTELNFESMNLGGGLTYMVPAIPRLAVYGRYGYNRLTGGDVNSELFQNHTFTFGLFRSFPLSRAHYLYGGASAQWGLSNYKDFERNIYAASMGYHLDMTEILSFDMSSRFSFVPYSRNDRRDTNETLYAGITLKPINYLYFQVFSSAGLNQSNQSSFYYDVLNFGGSAGIQFRF
ncbi:MAG: hypothetical protein WCJ37_05250 [Syntrophus sp. (in: bacteria)]